MPVAPTSAEQAKAQELSRASRLARQAESDGDWARALDLWQFVEKERPGDYSAYGGIRRSLVSLSRFDEALKFLDQSLKSAAKGKMGLDPASIAADRVEVLFAAGREADALDEIEKQVAAQRAYPNIYRNIANVLYSQRRGDEAVALLRRGRADSGDPYLFAREVAQFAEARMDWETAVAEYLLYLSEAPDNLSYVTGALGDIALEPGGDTLVNAAILKHIAVLKAEQTAPFLELQAGLLFRAQRYTEALDAYRRLDRLRGGEGSLLLELAQRLTGEGEARLALDAYNDFLVRNPRKELLYRALLGKARTCERLGLLDSTRAACEAVLTPGAPLDAVVEANFRLGRDVLIRNGSPETARRYFETALKVARQAAPSFGTSVEEIQIQLAMTYQLESRLDLAQKELEKVVKLSGARAYAAPQARLELARLAFRRGDLEAAKREADALLAADPTAEAGNEAVELSALLDGLKESPEALKMVGQADLLALLGKAEEAERILDSLAGKGASSRIKEEALWQNYALQVRSMHPLNAIKLLDRIIALGDGAVRRDKALFEAGLLAEGSLANPARARAYCESLLGEHPESPLAERTRRFAKALARDQL